MLRSIFTALTLLAVTGCTQSGAPDESGRPISVAQYEDMIIKGPLWLVKTSSQMEIVKWARCDFAQQKQVGKVVVLAYRESGQITKTTIIDFDMVTRLTSNEFITLLTNDLRRLQQVGATEVTTDKTVKLIEIWGDDWKCIN